MTERKKFFEVLVNDAEKVTKKVGQKERQKDREKGR
jgi:hypothetical protein